MREKVEEALNKIRPMLAADGGDVELVDVNDGIVQIRSVPVLAVLRTALWPPRTKES